MPVAGIKDEIAAPTKISCGDKIKTEGVRLRRLNRAIFEQG